MASVSRPPLGAGGKMVRPRRRAAPITPYRRPQLLSNSGERNPSWISRIILSPTRLIASGAGKVLSSVFGPESSSSSSSSSGTDSNSEDDIDDANNDDSPLASDRMNEEKRQPVDWKSETKRVIEQLVMQETFSWEEYERLIHIIKTRVIDSSGMTNTPERIQNRTVDSAIIEAQKWLEEKKLGSTSMSELDPGTTAFKSALLTQVISGEVGSPVDMAKSYMQSRPPWASQSSNRFKSPVPSAVQLFREETPYSVSINSLSSSKVKRDSPTTGSWNILEEIRRVRSKAMEMRTPPSCKNDWSGFALDRETTSTALFADNLEGCTRTKMHESSKSADVLNLDGGVNTPEGVLGACMQDSLEEPPLNSGQSFHPAEDIKVVSHSDTGDAAIDILKDTNRTSQPLSPVMGQATQDSRLHEVNGSLLKEATGATVAVASNGSPSFRPSLSAGIDKVQNPTPFSEKISVDPGHDKEIEVASVKETCEILSEASVEVVVANGSVNAAPDSQNTSSLHQDASFEDPAQPGPKPSPVGPMDGVSKRGRKLSRYNRRGRGRGK